MRFMTLLVCTVCLGFAITGRCLAADVGASQSDPTDQVLAVKVTGTMTPKGIFLLSLETGPIPLRTVRVYSEPSHTLLLVAIDEEFRKSADGQAWEKGYVDVPAQAITTTHPMAGAQMNLGIPGPPAADTHIQVWISAKGLDGTEEERLISDGAVKVRDFSFTTSVDPDSLVAREHCCSGADCGTHCTFCSGPGFCCCLIYPNCNIECAPCLPCQ